jgi:O-antigen/teichoic acid export membrane protein
LPPRDAPGDGPEEAAVTAGEPPPPAARSPEISQVARGSLTNVAAMVAGALLGFALTVLVSRWLQPRSAGALFELIAMFTILSNTLELGADTGLTRWISRARATGELGVVRRIVAIALLPVAATGVLVAGVMWLLAPVLAQVFLHGMTPSVAVGDIRLIAPLVSVGALSSCVLAGPRGFARMWPYLAIEGLGKPTLRMGLVAVVLALGWGLQGAIVAWCIPVVLGLLGAWIILARLMRTDAPPSTVAAAHHGHRAAPQPPPGRDGRSKGRHRGGPRPETRLRRRLAAEFWGFAAPRAFAGTFQIVVVWLDVLLVGALLSRYAAGVYGAVSKLAVVGTFALEGTRLAIAPQLSGLMARKEWGRAAELYQSATRWLILASWPLYIVFAIFPMVLLGIFGHRYQAGAASLVVLSLAMLVNLGTGNVTVVLLMGGKSSWNVVNAGAALTVNVVLNLILLPRIGIVGAAIAWAASIVVDNIAAVIEVRWLLGLACFGRGYLLVTGSAAACFGLTGVASRILLGDTLAAAVLAAAAGVLAYAGITYATRSRLDIPPLTEVLRPSPARLPDARPDQQAA